MNPVPDEVQQIHEMTKMYLSLADTRVLCSSVLHRIDASLLKLTGSTKGTRIWRVVFFVAPTFATPILVDLLTKNFTRGNTIKIASAVLVTAFVVFVVRYLGGVLFPAFVDLVVQKMCHIEGKREMYEWLPRYTSLETQFAWSGLATIVTAGILVWARTGYSGFVLSPGTHVALGVMFFFGTQLPYWSIAIIDAFRILSRHRLRIHSFNPAGDETIVHLNELVMLTLSLGAIIVLVFLALTYVLILKGSSVSLVRIVFIGWYVFAFVVAVALLAFPSFFLSRIVVLEKRRLLGDLQSRIEKIYLEMNGIDTGKLAEIEKAWEIYRLIEKTPNTSISWEMLRTFLGAIGIQSLPLINLLDWHALLKQWFPGLI